MLLKHSSRSVKRLRIPSSKGPSRQAKEAIKHVEEGWIPVDPLLLHEIQENLEAGFYIDHPNILLEEIKRDPGLFFFLAKNLKDHVSPDDRVAGFDPISQLKKLESEKVGSILSVTAKDISALHALSNPSLAQQSQKQLARLSAITAETFATKLSIQPDHAFSNSLFRHLGHELISWNYPHIFSRALTLHRTKGEPIDAYLKRTLGIAPHELSLRFARQWGMSTQIERTINATARPIDADDTEMEGKDLNLSLGKLCQISELFAQSKDPLNFPEAENKWAAREQAIEEVLGKEVLEEIEDKAEKVIIESEQPPEEKKIFGVSAPLLSRQEKNVFDRNHYVKQLPKWLRGSFLNAYQEIKEGELALDAIRVLTDTVIPKAGFIRGCLYLQDKDTLQLEPALRFGDILLQKYKDFLLDSRNGIAISLHTSAPTKKDGQGVRGEHITQICGSLRNNTHPGVLYLEIPDGVDADPEFDAVTHFHAVRQALCDCLKEL